MKECDNSKIHISSNFIVSLILIMFDTLSLRPSLHRNTPLQFTTLHPTTLHFLSFTLHYPLIYISYRSISPHVTKLDTVQFSFPNLFLK